MNGRITLRHGISRFLTDEAGSQTLEFVALLPLVILVLLIMLQTAFFAYTVVVAESSAREAALVASQSNALIEQWPQLQDQSPIAKAAKQTASGMNVDVQGVACSDGNVTVTVEAAVPNLLFESALELGLKATMPTQEGGCP